MAKYRIKIDFKTEIGTSSSTQEVAIPDSLNSKIGNSAYKSEIISSLESALPSIIGGVDWRKRGWKVTSYNCVVKL